MAKQKGKQWTDAKGKQYETWAINPVIKLEEKHAQRILDLAKNVERALVRLRQAEREAHDEIYQAKMKDAHIKGNQTPADSMTFYSFDQSVEVKITKPDAMFFDNDMVKVVSEKFEKYFESFGKENETISFLRDIVNDLLFKKGSSLDTTKILKLRKYRDRLIESKHKTEAAQLFIEAVDMFDKAIRTKAGNTGLYVSERKNESEQYTRVRLKITDI